jgi:hypothetical protein
MALTAAEQAELEQLEREEREEQERNKGVQAVAAVQAARPPQRGPRPFSLYRATVGALRDAVQGVQDTFEDSIRPQFMTPMMGAAAAGINLAQEKLFGRDPKTGYVELPRLKGEEDAGIAERITRGIGSFLVPFAGASKLLGVARGATWLGRAGRAMAAGAVVDFAQVDPVSGNMANFLRDTFGIENSVLDALASEEDDEALYNRFKAAAVNAPVGLAADALFETGFRAVKAYRAWKGTAEEAEEAIRAVKRDYAIEPVKRQKATKTDADGAAKAEPEDVEFWEVPPEYNPSRDASTRPQPESFEDVLDYLKRQAGTEVDEAALARLADNLLWGNPENALAKLGIDPAKLDFSLYDDPEMMARLQKGLGEVYEFIASKLGRSNIRVTERATIEAARTLGSTADVLKDVHGATANLAEGLTGARLFVGAHAHKLLADADAAIDEITAGIADGPAWARFLQSFHRHAYYLGVVRGAGSEVGRALRSLQIIGKVAKPGEVNDTLQAALSADAKEGRVLDAVKSKIEQGASDYADRLGTPAERLDALMRLKDLRGDVGELSREVRRQNGSTLRRVDDALRETVGNLFGTGTAMYNLAAGATMMGTRLLAKGLVATTRMALSPLGGRFSREARIAAMDAWAYTDGIVSGFRAAYAATLDVLEKEGFAEIAHNVDGLGLKDMALRAAKKSADADTRLVGGSYERTDVKNHRAFGISASENLMLQRKIAELSGPEFYKTALGYLAKAGASTVNALGTLSRAGTIAFINLPDQFVGTLAARAGSYSKAVRIAASEAAELGLEGKAWSPGYVGLKDAGRFSFETGKKVVVEAQHGTAGTFDEFDPDKLGSFTGARSARKAFFFTSRPKTAEYYAESATRQANMYRDKVRFAKDENGYYTKVEDNLLKPNVMTRFLKMDNPRVVDMKGKLYREQSYAQILDEARAAGHDGVIIRRTFDSGEYGRFDAAMKGRFQSETIYAVFDKAQILKEAGERAVERDVLSDYLKARTVQLMGDGKGWHPDAVKAGEADTMAAAGEREAREVLFQDDLELGINRAVSRGLTNAVGLHLIVPFVKTPLRILERTAIDYTPLGLLKDRVRRAVIAGGPEGEEAMARIALGTLAVTSAYLMAADRTIVGQDGGLASSARLSRGSYTLRIGDDQVEFSRVDPLGTLLGFGADLHAFFDAMADDPEASGQFQQGFEAFIWATTANILSKSWLTSVRNLADLAGMQGGDGADIGTRTTRFLSQFAGRFVPASGAQRQAEKVLDGYVRQAVTFSDQLFKSSLGSSSLPLKRDTIVGRPVPVEGLDRIIGVRAAPAAGDDDPLLKELEALSFDLPSPRRTVLGVKLSGAQFSRYLELRGQVLTKPDTGLTLEQTLTKLIELPEYQGMTRRQKIEAIRAEMDGFSQMAADVLLKEDRDFAYRALRKETYDRVLVQGGDRLAADAETRRFAAQLGLTPTE